MQQGKAQLSEPINPPAQGQRKAERERADKEGQSPADSPAGPNTGYSSMFLTPLGRLAG